jgi:hypothetical protein
MKLWDQEIEMMVFGDPVKEASAVFACEQIRGQGLFHSYVGQNLLIVSTGECVRNRRPKKASNNDLQKQHIRRA